MRIALFTDTYLPQVNGVSRTLARLVGHLHARGHEVALVSPRASEEPAMGTALHLRLPGVPVPVYPELLLTRLVGRRDREVLERFDPQVVHCATESTVGWGGRAWARRTGRPLVTSFHTNFPEYAREYGMGLLAPVAWGLLRRFHEPALRTLCPSNATLEELKGRGFHDRLGIWSRGVDSALFTPARRSAELRRSWAPDAEMILLFVGRLAGEKRLDVLMEAWPKVREATARKAALVLVGDGPLGAELRARHEPGVHFTGYLSGTALADAYASADIFAFPSDTETFGNVVTEAMASGVPVVGADQGGVRDTIRPGETGFLAAPRDADSFAAALLPLMENDALRRQMGAEARLDAESRGWDRILDGVVDVYEEALAGGDARGEPGRGNAGRRAA